MFARVITTITGIVLFIYGVIAAISPLPLGAPLAVLGLFMIAGANPAFRPVIRAMRRRWAWFNRLVLFMAPRAGLSVQFVVDETDPDRQNSGQGESGMDNEKTDRPDSL